MIKSCTAYLAFYHYEVFLGIMPSLLPDSLPNHFRYSLHRYNFWVSQLFEAILTATLSIVTKVIVPNVYQLNADLVTKPDSN